jgi:hypothetical protein
MTATQRARYLLDLWNPFLCSRCNGEDKMLADFKSLNE